MISANGCKVSTFSEGGAAKRAIKPVVNQRKNSLFYCSESGARNAATFNTLIIIPVEVLILRHNKINTSAEMFILQLNGVRCPC